MQANISNTKQQLIHLGLIVEKMLALSGMIRGSYGTTHHRCGRSTCWCANPKKKGHFYAKLMWTDEEGPKTRSVHDEDTHTVLEAIGQDREFKRLRRQLKKKMNQLENSLAVFQRQTTSENRSKMGFS